MSCMKKLTFTIMLSVVVYQLKKLKKVTIKRKGGVNENRKSV